MKNTPTRKNDIAKERTKKDLEKDSFIGRKR